MNEDKYIIQQVIRQMDTHGVSSLSDEQLLCLIIGHGDGIKDVLTVAKGILRRYSLEEIISLPRKLLSDKLSGITESQIALIQACPEIYSRVNKSECEKSAISSAKDVYEMMRGEMVHFKKEYFRVIMVNNKLELIGTDDVSIGSIDSANAHPREVFRSAIAYGAYGIFLVHNHPSGNPTPSASDHYATSRIRESGEIIGIQLIDHVIIAARGYYSFNSAKTFGPNQENTKINDSGLKMTNIVL